MGKRDQRTRAKTVGVVGSLTAVLTLLLGLLTEVGANLLPSSWIWLKDPWTIASIAVAAVALLIILVAIQARIDGRGAEAEGPADDDEPRSARTNNATVSVSGGQVGQLVTAPGGTVHLASGPSETELRRVIDDLFRKNLEKRLGGSNDDVDNVPDTSSIEPPLGRLERPVRGRMDILSLLRDKVTGANARARVNVLCGLGGCGKSTIALEVAKYAIDHSVRVLWVSASSSTALHSGMRQVAAALGATQDDLLAAWGGRGSATDLVWQLLNECRSHWILIIDNADEPSDLSDGDGELRDGTGWLRAPKSENGSVIVTSRDCNPEHWAAWCTLHEIPMLGSSDAADVLMDRAGIVAGDITDARDLAKRLDGLPLALHLAGTYLRSNADAPWDGAIKTFKAYEAALDNSMLEAV